MDTEVSLEFSWWVAGEYEITDGVIHAVSKGAKRRYPPLAERDLFPSLARLADRKDGPTENQALRWVRKHGMLFGPNDFGHYGAPTSVEEFRARAREAHGALTLLHGLETRDVEALRSRITLQNPGPGPSGQRTDTRDVFVDSLPAGHVVGTGDWLEDKDVLLIAKSALRACLLRNLQDRVRLDFGEVYDHPRGLGTPGEESRLARGLVPTDLHAALWLQFSDLVEARGDWAICGGCGQPFLKRRGNQKVCANSPACNKRLQRSKKS